MGDATIADLVLAKEAGLWNVGLGPLVTCTPSLGLLVGGFTAHIENWYWIQLPGAAFVLLFFFSPQEMSRSSTVGPGVFVR